MFHREGCESILKHDDEVEAAVGAEESEKGVETRVNVMQCLIWKRVKISNT